MSFEVTNKMRQIQNCIIRGEDGRSATLTLMPRGQGGHKKEISDTAMTEDLRNREAKKLVKIKEIAEEESA